MKQLLVAGAFGLAVLNGAFASEANMSVDRLEGGKSYFKVLLAGSADLKDGKYPGWCADWDRAIEENTSYHYRFYSSYHENLPAGLVDHPEYLDEVNWIANKPFVGRDAGEDLGVYTSGDVQLAIWTLIDDSFDASTVGPYSQARVDRIVALAKKYGSGFHPNCKQDVVLVLDPGTPQSVLVEIPRKHFKKCVVPEEG
jgi:hypothetical protein